MGGSSSQFSKEQVIEIQRLIQRWANDQDSQTNSAMRSQYTRVTDLMNQLSQRLTDRQDATQERLERQVKELQEQLENMQKKMKSSDEPSSSGNRINDLLNDLQNIIGHTSSGKGGFDGYPTKMPHPPMNYSGPVGLGFGPGTMHLGHGGQQFNQQGYQRPYVPNPNIPHPAGSLQQNFYPYQPPHQQPYSTMGPLSGNPYRPSTPAQFASKGPATKNENWKDFKKNSKGPTKKSESQKTNLTIPELRNVGKYSKKSNDPEINKILKCFEESRKKIAKNPKATESEKVKDIVEEMVSKFKLQEIEDENESTTNNADSDKSKNAPTKCGDKRDFANKRRHRTSGAKFSQKNDGGEKKGDDNTSNRNDKTESGDRRYQYKQRGRDGGSFQQWRDKNREARKKQKSRNLNVDVSDSDSNESVMSNFSSVSKKSTVSAEKSKKCFWTSLPNYARDYNFERAKAQIELVVKGLDLENYTNKVGSDDEDASTSTSECRSESQNRSRMEEKKDANKNFTKNSDEHKEERNSRDENENIEKGSKSEGSNLNVISYPTEQDAARQSLDIEKPLDRPLVFLGLTETGEHHTHQPKCLADIYRLEKIYKTFKLVSLK